MKLTSALCKHKIHDSTYNTAAVPVTAGGAISDDEALQ